MANELGYKLQRKTNGGSYSQIASLGANVVGYNDTGLSAGTTYYYRVAATNSYGGSSWSAEASDTTIAFSDPHIGLSPLSLVVLTDVAIARPNLALMCGMRVRGTSITPLPQTRNGWR